MVVFIIVLISVILCFVGFDAYKFNNECKRILEHDKGLLKKSQKQLQSSSKKDESKSFAESSRRLSNGFYHLNLFGS